MNNNLMLYGLDVIQISPNPYQPDVNVNASIRIVFNGELNESTVFGNIFILEDTNNVYKGDKVIDVTKYKQIPGSLVYGNKVVLFTPETPLIKETRYIIYIPARTIKEILGKRMELDYVSYFVTETVASLPPSTIVFPKPGAVIDKIQGVVWETQNVQMYVVEISKQPTFEHMVFNQMTENPSVDSDGNVSLDVSNVDLPEGLYYVRVRAANGVFGEPTMFFIKTEDKIPVSTEDIRYIDVAEEPFQEEIEVLEVFPEDGFSNVATNLKIMYVKLNQVIPPELASQIVCSVTGELSDEDDMDSIVPHGDMIGTWTLVNDATMNESYIIFTPEAL